MPYRAKDKSPDRKRLVTPCTSTVQFVACIRDLSIQIAALKKQSPQKTTQEISL